MVGIDPSWADLGVLRPREFHRGENIVPTTFTKYFEKNPLDPQYKKGDPRAWQEMGMRGYSGTEYYMILDGDPTTAYTFFLTGGDPVWGFWTLDFGTPIPAYQFVFYPRQEGLDYLGSPSKENFMKGYKVSGGLGVGFPVYDVEGWPGGVGGVPHLEHILGYNAENDSSIVTIKFPTQFIRLFRLQNIADLPFEIAEIEIYADGFAAEATYTSKVIDLDRVLLLGTLGWAGSTWRRTEDGSLVPAPNAEVSVAVETRSGRDDTPLVYHKTTNRRGKEEEITEEEYYHSGLSPPPTTTAYGLEPNQQGSITYDTENWSFWSLPHSRSGEKITSPSPRRYFQFRITLRTSRVDELARVDSLWFETSPPLVDEVVGEIAVLGDPTPSGEVARVAGGQRTTFTYDVKATLSRGQKGFDGVEITVPSQATFKDLLMGDPLVPLPQDEYEVDTLDPSRLIVLFPSHRVVDGTPLRVVFDTAVLVLGTPFAGAVFDSKGLDLPQPIKPGNAHDEVSTNKLYVLVTETSLEGGILSSVEVTPTATTPNGDGVNDEVGISYTLLQLTEEASIEISIYDLSGLRVRLVYAGKEMNGKYDQSSGPYRRKVWDGRDDEGDLVAPGLYVYRLSVRADEGIYTKAGTIAVMY